MQMAQCRAILDAERAFQEVSAMGGTLVTNPD
jgi:hypothetical protein